MTTRAETGSTFPPKRILVAYDSIEDSLDAVLVAAEWAPLFSAEVTLLHVMEPETHPGLFAHYTLSVSHVKRINARFREALVRVGGEHLGAVKHETAVIHAQVAPGIADYANEKTFDLVVLATHNRSKIAHALFGSVAERVTQMSDTPVLTVRKPPATSVDAAAKRSERRSKPWNRFTSEPDRSAPIAVERSPDRTVIRFHDRESLAGIDLGLVEGLWAVLEDEACDPKSTIMVIARPGLLSPENLERLVVGSDADDGVTSATLRTRIIREENVIQRYIKTVRSLDSFVIGVAGGDIALHLAAPLLACDYRIISPGTVFVNTTQTLPNAPLGCLPWLLAKMVGGAQSTHLLLDVPRLSADDALALGLVNHITASAQFEDEAFEVAERIGSLPRATLIGLKRCMTAANDDFQSYSNQEMRLTEQLSSSHTVV
jgi:nucleotide-binding universal stress UspA family protein/enoyl-CoA hydratase/carnithine racemase